MNAAEIDTKIKELEAKLEDKIAKKMYSECSGIQEEIESLKKTRETCVFSLAEIEKKMSNLQVQIEENAKKRNFVLCGQLQEQYDLLQEEIKQKNEEKNAVKQQKQNMQQQLKDAKLELEKLIASKQYDKCTSLQSTIETLEKKLGEFSEVDDDEEESQDVYNKNEPMEDSPPCSPRSSNNIMEDSPPCSPRNNYNNAMPQARVSIAGFSSVSMNNSVNTRHSFMGSTATVRAPFSSMSAAVKSKVQGFKRQPFTSMMPKMSNNKKLIGGKPGRTVSQLRPAKPLTISEHITISEAAKLMKPLRMDAAIVVSDEGLLLGILTDTDITRRVVSCHMDINKVKVMEVMTANPKCVCEQDGAIDSLQLMLKGRFRHLPVVEESGGVVSGLLSFNKCLYDAIRFLEENNKSGNGNLNNMMAKFLHEPTLEQVLRNSVLPPICSQDCSVLEVVEKMAKTRKAALIVSSPYTEDLVGIFTPKDLLLRVVACELDPEHTMVADVMTKNPDIAYGETKIIEAFHILHEGNFLNLPVVKDKVILGMADVFVLSQGSFEQAEDNNKQESDDLWSSAFKLQYDTNTIHEDEESEETNSSVRSRFAKVKYPSAIKSGNNNSKLSSNVNSFILNQRKQASMPNVLSSSSRYNNNFNFGQGKMYGFDDETSSMVSSTASSMAPMNTFVFKVKDSKSNVHRMRCKDDNFDQLYQKVSKHFQAELAEEEGSTLKCLYKDDDGDLVLLACDSDLKEAVQVARKNKWKRIFLIVEIVSSKQNEQPQEQQQGIHSFVRNGMSAFSGYVWSK